MQKSLHGACRALVEEVDLGRRPSPPRARLSGIPRRGCARRRPARSTASSGCSCGLLRDQRVGRAQHAVAAAVVLLELDDLQRRIVAAQLQQVVRIGAAPGVDRLVVVAHAGEIAAAARPAPSAGGTARRWCPGIRRPAGSRCARARPATHSASDSSSCTGRRIRSSKSTALNVGQARLVARVQRRGFALAHAAARRRRLLRRQAGVLRARDQVAARRRSRRACCPAAAGP